LEGIRRSRRSTRINSQNCGDSSSKNWYILVNEKTKWEAREAFNKCRQQFNESIVQFKQRYDDRIAALRALAEHILDEPALAINFIHKLEMRRYHELRKDYENNLYDRVENLDAAYGLASNYVVKRRNDRGLCRVFIADTRGGRSERGRGSGRMRDGKGGRGRATSRPVAAGDHPLKGHVYLSESVALGK